MTEPISNPGIQTSIEPPAASGLHAPPHLTGWRKWWWWFDFIVLVNLARLRFIALLAVIGLIITKWDLLISYYDRWTRPAMVISRDTDHAEWFCPMHPTIVRQNPNEKCPICFMPLSKRTKTNLPPEPLPAGTVNRVQLTPYRIVLAGVQTWNVDYVPLVKQISAVGYVEFNESGQRTISARFNARVDKLLVSETGRMVKEGDELASIYSPELVVAIESLLNAKKTGNRELLANTRTRLQLLGISNQQMDEILAKETAETHHIIRSPISGHVIQKYIREGQYVTEGMPLFDVADLSTVWIQAQVYEDDLLFLPEGLTHSVAETPIETLPVTATTKALPNEEFHGMLTFVYPHVDQQTRTVTVRFDLDNPNHKLRPGSAVTVTLQVPPERWALVSGFGDLSTQQHDRLDKGELLAVPQSAIIDTGSQKIAYHETAPGVFDGVLVKLGPKMSGPDGAPFFPVLDGLQRGMKVVTNGSFLIDAETRLNPATGSLYSAGSTGSAGSAVSTTMVRPSTPGDPDSKIAATLAKLSTEDRKAAEAQRFCPIRAENRLGAMGVPVKLTIAGESVFLCCEGCREAAMANASATVQKVHELQLARAASAKPPSATSLSDDKLVAALAKLSPEDRSAAESQRFCAVLEKNRLGSMGAPVKLMIEGQPVFVCCASCRRVALKNPQQALAKAKQLAEGHHD